MGSCAGRELSDGAARLYVRGAADPGDGGASRDDPFRGMIRSNHHAMDITEEFTRASNALGTCQLVKDDCFTLFDSVQALEVMDPKMDSGYLQPGETLDDYHDVCRSMLPEEIVGIMDQLLCYEMAWHQGYPLAQNVFTSLYIDYLLAQKREKRQLPTFYANGHQTPSRQEKLVHLVLRAYCIGIIKSCDLVIEVVQLHQYYEEEDFNTHTFNREMLNDVEDDDCLKLLDEAEKWLNNQSGIEQDLAEALLIRLKARKDFMAAAFPPTSETLAKKDWDTFKSRILGLQKSHQLGKPVPGSFSAKVQRRLASTVPPRPTSELPFREACRNLSTLYDDIEEALRISDPEIHSRPESLLTFLWTFSGCDPPPSTFARAVLQTLLFSEGRIADRVGAERLLHTMLDQVLPATDKYLENRFWDIEVPTDWRYKVAKDVDFFIGRVTTDYQNLLRTICQNRCRVRRCLANVVRDFDVLQQDLHDHYFGNDTRLSPNTPEPLDKPANINLTLCDIISQLHWRIAAWVICLGFEQDLYQTQEIPMLYRYLASQARERRSSILQTQRLLSHFEDDASASSIGMRDLDLFQLDRKSEALTMQALDSEVIDVLATGLADLYSLLEVLPKMSVPTPTTPKPYENIALQLEIRLRPLIDLKYVNASGQLQNQVDRANDVPFDEKLGSAQAHLERARDLVRALLKMGAEAPEAVGAVGSEAEWKTATSQTYRSIVTANIIIASLKKGLERCGGDLVELGRRITITYQTGEQKGFWLVPGVVVK